MKKICLAAVLATVVGSSFACDKYVKYAYVTNSDDNSYTQCNVKKNVIDKESCKTIKLDGILNQPVGIAINENFAYIANYGDNSYTQCSVKDGLVDSKSCKTTKPEGKGALAQPHGVSFACKYVFFTNMKNSSVTKCEAGKTGIDAKTCETTVLNLSESVGSAFMAFTK